MGGDFNGWNAAMRERIWRKKPVEPAEEKTIPTDYLRRRPASIRMEIFFFSTLHPNR